MKSSDRSNHRSSPVFAPLLVIGSILLIISAGLLRFGSTYLAALALFTVLILAPGATLERLLVRSDNYPERAAYSFAFGVSWASVLFVALIWMGFDLTAGWGRFLPFLFVLCLIGLYLFKKPALTAPPSKPLTRVEWLTVGICLFFSFILLFNESMTILGSDGLSHIFIVKHALAARNLEGYAEGIKAVALETRAWRWAIQPFILMWTGATSMRQFMEFTSIVAPFIFCGFYAFCRSLFASSRFYAICMLLFAVHFGGYISNFSHSDYSWYIAWGIVFPALSLVLRGTREKNVSLSAGGVALGFCAVLIHFNLFLIFIGALICLVLARSFWSQSISPARKTILGVLVITAILGPLIVFLAVRSRTISVRGSSDGLYRSGTRLSGDPNSRIRGYHQFYPDLWPLGRTVGHGRAAAHAAALAVQTHRRRPQDRGFSPAGHVFALLRDPEPRTGVPLLSGGGAGGIHDLPARLPVPLYSSHRVRLERIRAAQQQMVVHVPGGPQNDRGHPGAVRPAGDAVPRAPLSSARKRASPAGARSPPSFPIIGFPTVTTTRR